MVLFLVLKTTSIGYEYGIKASINKILNSNYLQIGDYQP